MHEHGIHYPVAIDNDYGTWQAYGNEYWPADYLIDRHGSRARRAVRRGQLREDRGRHPAAARRASEPIAATHVKAIAPSLDTGTPETYLGSERGTYTQKIVKNVMHRYVAPSGTTPNEVSLLGSWKVSGQYLTAGPGATIRLPYRHVGPTSCSARARIRTSVEVTVTGAPARSVKVDHDGLYNVASTPGASRLRVLIAKVPPGVRAYSFTFG